MASIGHIAAGLAASRVVRGFREAPTMSSIAAWSALSMLPDADVAGMTMGIPYEAPWGHRGATHSFAFALGVALLIGAAARLRRQPALRVTCIAALVLISHPVFDTFTNGGLGCALFWPFDDTRYFAPWTPIPVSPIGLSYFSPYGLMVAITEIVFFSPLLVFGLWPFRDSAPAP